MSHVVNYYTLHLCIVDITVTYLIISHCRVEITKNLRATQMLKFSSQFANSTVGLKFLVKII